eukprot:m.243909 g.243909  ORF g.243909 m.243909 type:complete len:132 (-) comp48636_c0_seq1:340-735(-)
MQWTHSLTYTSHSHTHSLSVTQNVLCNNVVAVVVVAVAATKAANHAPCVFADPGHLGKFSVSKSKKGREGNHVVNKVLVFLMKREEGLVGDGDDAVLGEVRSAVDRVGEPCKEVTTGRVTAKHLHLFLRFR